jgi:glutathione S-transferase
MTMSELQIIGAPASNFVRVVRIACAEKGVAYTLDPALPQTPEIKALHPFGKIPAMRHGAFTLCESRAICLYIERTFAGPALMPDDPAAAARVEQWISIVNTHVDPALMRRYLRAYFFPDTADGSPDRKAIDAVLPEMRTQFAVLDESVAQTGHLAGGTFTLADINLLPILFYMTKMPESRELLAQARHLKAYYERHAERPSVKQTLPESLPERFAHVLAQVA